MVATKTKAFRNDEVLVEVTDITEGYHVEKITVNGFFIDDFKRLGENIFTSLLTFASQPASIFSGWHKVIFLTILPAGVISLYPVRLIQNFNLVDLGLMFISILFFFVLSIFTYHKGLKRYASGNRFGVR